MPATAAKGASSQNRLGRDQRVIAAETDKLTERALATFEPAEREAVIHALGAIRRHLTAGG